MVLGLQLCGCWIWEREKKSEVEMCLIFQIKSFVFCLFILDFRIGFIVCLFITDKAWNLIYVQCFPPHASIDLQREFGETKGNCILLIVGMQLPMPGSKSCVIRPSQLTLDLTTLGQSSLLFGGLCS